MYPFYGGCIVLVDDFSNKDGEDSCTCRHSIPPSPQAYTKTCVSLILAHRTIRNIDPLPSPQDGIGLKSIYVALL